MKRNITVNIFGSLYPMDEDAYAMLNAYIANMRDYFSRQPDGKEIADDIEGRVAELMSELRQNGAEAISIEHVEEIINRVGKPEQFIDQEEDMEINQQIPPNPEKVTKKKLFRDPERKLLAGVFAGLGCYLGLNPLWLRLGYILLIFCLFVNMPDTLPIILLLICGYFICWGSIPLASNPAERLQMKGEPVNLSNMCEEFLTSTKEILSRQSNLNKDGWLTNGIISILKFVCIAFGIFLLVAGGIALITIILSVIGLFSYPWDSSIGIYREDFPIFQIIDSNSSWLIWTAAISIILFIGLSLYLTVHFIFRLFGHVRPLSNPLRIVCIIVWLASMMICASTCSKIGGNTVNYIHHLNASKTSQETPKEIIEKQQKQLKDAGWEISLNDNTKRLSNHGQHFSGNKNINYLEGSSGDNDMGMKYEVRRMQKLAPGIYRLEAKARTNGNGAEIFANNETRRYSSPIPVCGSKGGSVWNDARIALESDTAKLLPNRNHLKNLTKVNDSKGFGWSDVVVENITVGSDSILWYGVTNVSPTQTWDGTWLSATAFELKRQE